MVGRITLHPLLGAAVNLYLVLLMWLDYVLSYVGLHKITYLYCKMRSTKTRLQCGNSVGNMRLAIEQNSVTQFLSFQTELQRYPEPLLREL